ncbi:MAG: ATP synthase F1 subunit delta [candidate division Zixibacteria bacterium]|nr:ATP synthase F1 subunit delta [candidate division Zixibacteria bacterium]
MLVHEVAKKYGQALFLSANSRGLIDAAQDQLTSLRQMLATDRTLLDFLAAPQVPDDKKLNLVRTVFAPRIERLFVEFIVVLVEKHRVNFLPEILDEFDRLVKEQKGILKVTVVTAIPLKSSEEQSLTERLVGMTKLKIDLTKKIDPAIVGGMILFMRGEIIDGSVRHGLNMLEEQLEKVKVA